MPPQHGKSTLLKHWLTKLVCQFPYYRHAYCSYGAKLAQPHNREIRDMVERLGVGLQSRAMADWSRFEGGGIVACGIPGSITGRPVDGIFLIDDPIRGRQDAESTVIRNAIWSWYTADVFSRTHNTTSIIVVATRWHEDDLTGRLTSGKHGDPFELVNIPAINEEGEPLWPEKHKLAKLLKAKRLSPYDFWALWMGSPRPRGASVFKAPYTVAFHQLPVGPCRTIIGVDLAYTASTSADHTVAVVMQKWANDPNFYVTYAERWRKRPEETIGELFDIADRYPGATFAFHGSTTEHGQALMMKALGLPINPKRAESDKLLRSGTTQVAWNGGYSQGDENPGRIVVVASLVDIEGKPIPNPWFADYAGEMQAFTGRGDASDDYIDGTTSAYLEHTGGGSGLVDVGGHSVASQMENYY